MKQNSGSAYFGQYSKNLKEHEVNILSQYLVQSGRLRDLSLTFVQAWHRGDTQLGGEVNQTRLYLAYPFKLL